jgi:hypothetical protein
MPAAMTSMAAAAMLAGMASGPYAFLMRGAAS